jgi:hypothetical protein
MLLVTFYRGTDNQKILKNMLKNTAIYCKYCKILQNSAKYCKILQDIANNTKFQEKLQNMFLQISCFELIISLKTTHVLTKIIIIWLEHQIDQLNRKFSQKNYVLVPQ